LGYELVCRHFEWILKPFEWLLTIKVIMGSRFLSKTFEVTGPSFSLKIKIRTMKPFFKTVLLTGLFVGATDLIAAYVNSYIKTGKFAGKMLQYIAGGALGLDKSMKGGFGIGLIGLFFHFFIAFSFTLLFFLLYPRLKFLRYNIYLTGFFYGWLVGTIMTFIILPLTALPPGAPFSAKAFIGWSILGTVLGIPIAWSARRYYRNYGLPAPPTPSTISL
jgi:hypothetical protein